MSSSEMSIRRCTQQLREGVVRLYAVNMASRRVDGGAYSLPACSFLHLDDSSRVLLMSILCAVLIDGSNDLVSKSLADRRA